MLSRLWLGLHMTEINNVACLQVNFQHIWVTVGSMLVSFTFVFGNMFKTLFESVVFLFVVHPFDVGDMISIGTLSGEPCTVRPARMIKQPCMLSSKLSGPAVVC